MEQIQLWGGVECTINRVGDRYFNQLERSGHWQRADNDLARFALFLQPYGFFDGDLVERVDRHFDIGEIDARPVGLDPDGDIEVDHPFDGDENLHCALDALSRQG